MKKITLLFLSVLLFATYSLQAQKAFTGELHMQTKIEGTDDPNITSSIPDMTIVISVLGNKMKQVQSFEGVAITAIWDGDKETTITVIEITGMGKFFKKTSAESYRDQMKLADFSYNYENEYREVCGYKCQKVVVTTTNLEDDSSTELICYVTKEIGSAKINGMQLPGLEGFPMLILKSLPEYCEECAMAQEVIKVVPKKIKDVDFLLPDDAKNIDDNPELKEMLKGAFGED